MTDTVQKQETSVVVAKRQAMPVPLGPTGMLVPSNLQEAIEIAKLIASSGMVPKNFDNNVGAVLVAMEFGAELGLPPMASLQNVAVINNRPCLWGDAVLAVVVGHPDCQDCVEEFDESTMTATCTIRRRGRQPVVRTFSQSDAKTAGLWGSNVWAKYPKRMLAMRARGFACRDSFPDALRGLRMAEEVRDYGVIDGEFVNAQRELTEGDHKFGFQPKAATPEQAPVPVSTAQEKPKEQTQPAPREMSAKEKAWREKQQKAAVAHDPVTGEVKEQLPASMGGPIAPEEQAKYDKIGGPPMDQKAGF